MARISPVPKLQFFDDNGNPLAGGKLYTYAAGTLNPLTTYTTAVGDVPHTNPIILDSRGEVSLWLGASLYDFVLNDENDVLVWSSDDIGGVTTFSDLVASNVSFSVTNGPSGTVQDALDGLIFERTAAEIAVGITPTDYYFSPGDVRRYGAVGDGSTNDRAAIQAAIDACEAAGGGAVFLPEGVYRITATLTVPNKVSIYGVGGEASVISALSCNALTFDSASYDRGANFYEDFGLVGAAGSTANWAAVECILPPGGVSGTDSRDGIHFNRVRLYDWNQGFILSDLWESSIKNCKFQKVRNPIAMGTYCLALRITDNYMVYESGDSHGGGADAYGIAYNGAVIEAVMLQGNQIFGFARGIHVSTLTYSTFISNDIAATVYGIYISSVNSSLSIIGNYVQVNGDNSVALFAPGLGSVPSDLILVQNNTFITAASVNTTGIKINEAANTNNYNWVIRENTFNNFDLYDIVLHNAGNIRVENNHCMSTLPTNSIYVNGVSKAPVHLIRNWCVKAIGNATAADITTGKLLLEYNTENNTYFPPTGTFSLTDASGAGLSITTTTGRYTISEPERICTCELNFTYPATASGLPSRLGGFPKASISGAAVATVGYRSEATLGYLQMASNAAEAYIETTAGVPITNATLSGDQTIMTVSYRY